MVADSYEDVLISLDLCTIRAGGTWYGIPVVLYSSMQHPEHISFLLGSRKQTELSFPLAPTLRDQKCSVLNSFVSADGRSPSLYHNASEKSDS